MNQEPQREKWVKDPPPRTGSVDLVNRPAVAPGPNDDVAGFFRHVCSFLSAWLILLPAVAGLASRFHFPLPNDFDALLLLTFLIVGPLSLFFTVPAFVLSFTMRASLSKMFCLAALNGLGVLGGLACIWGILALSALGPINPG